MINTNFRAANRSLTTLSGTDFARLSDTELLQRAEKYGTQTRLWRQKFLGLLPEIARRELYRQKGFDSIFTYAFMVGGVSELQVRTVLRLEKKLEKTPELHELLIRGEVSHHKLDRVASIAQPENETFLVNQVQLLSQRSLDTLVKDEKHDELGLCAQTLALSPVLKLEEDVEKELVAMQQKGIDINGELRIFLTQRKAKIVEEKENLAQEQMQKEHTYKQNGTSPSRHIPQRIQNLLKKEFGIKCAKDGCNKAWQDQHHTTRFAFTKSHNPYNIAPLCREHHKIAHSIDVQVQKHVQQYKLQKGKPK